jgi:ParB family chromosome partitioning protein
MEVIDILVDEISLCPYQMRKNFLQEEIVELAATIQSVGLLQPLVVRKRANGYELISGERRLRAVKTLGWKQVPAAVIPMEKSEAALSCLIENIQRVELNPMEIAEAYANLLQEWNITQDELAKRTGKKRSSVSNYLRLHHLPHEIKVALAGGKISFGHAKVLLSCSSKETQSLLCRKVVQDQLSVRDLEKLIEKEPSSKSKVKKNVDPHLQTFVEKLMYKFGTEVKLDTRQKTLLIQWDSMETLERILEELGVLNEG